jgi:dimethylaniline monooxygenase (N-oxide forming)
MNKAIVIGSGSAGLIAAKELKDAGIEVKIIEKSSTMGGIWANLPWKNYTLTSSKWVTEYGCYPMPDEFPDFLANGHMVRYLESFVAHFNLQPLMEFNVHVKSIEKNEDGSLKVRTDREVYQNIDFVVVSTGLHGQAFIPQYAGLDQFKGTVSHSSIYQDPEPFRGRTTLCIGLGESGVGLVAELAGATKRLIVSSEGVAVAPRVVKGSHNPFDQMQFWQVGRFMVGYQEVLTSGLSWYYRKIPGFLKKYAITHHLKFYSDYGVDYEEFRNWIPKALVPNHFHVKFWAKPCDSNNSGNLTRSDAPPDDLFYLIKTNKIVPKGRVRSFNAEGVFFDDGSFENVDSVIFNTGYKPGSNFIEFPNGWKYRHLDLFKGCIHPEIPNLAFIGMVRPTIGSIPAMAEMHARVVAAYFSGAVELPNRQARLDIIAQDNAAHLKQFSKLHDRFPHIYFFDDWMEKMSAIIGAKPRLRDHWRSLAGLKAYFFGAPMPLRYRITGPGKAPDAAETYRKRVNKVWGNAFGKWAASTVLIHLIAPYFLAVVAVLLALSGGLPMGLATLCGGAIYLLYRYVDLFRFVADILFSRPLALASGIFFVHRMRNEQPNYEEPRVFQTDV